MFQLEQARTGVVQGFRRRGVNLLDHYLDISQAGKAIEVQVRISETFKILPTQAWINRMVEMERLGPEDLPPAHYLLQARITQEQPFGKDEMQVKVAVRLQPVEGTEGQLRVGWWMERADVEGLGLALSQALQFLGVQFFN